MTKETYYRPRTILSRDRGKDPDRKYYCSPHQNASESLSRGYLFQHRDRKTLSVAVAYPHYHETAVILTASVDS
ncbi:hypothetical protein D3C80_1209760 [compost metagenome]